jgi:hypothetical protein
MTTSSVRSSHPVARAASAAAASAQGLTLVHFSAQRKHFSGTRWVPSVFMWVITRHKVDREQRTDQNGLG